MEPLKIHLAETFLSPQGEGLWTGTMMRFFRVAGCPVGHYVRHQEYAQEPSPVPGLNLLKWLEAHPNHSVCQAAHNNIPFPCDTNYKVQERMSLDELLMEAANHSHVCLTGGEPLAYVHAHQLLRGLLHTPWANAPVGTSWLHIETSGTVSIMDAFSWASGQCIKSDFPRNLWITCAPKRGFLPDNAEYVDEWKFVVSRASDADGIRRFIEQYCNTVTDDVFLQPLGDLKHTPVESYEACMLVQEDLYKRGYQNVRIGQQLHKLLNVR